MGWFATLEASSDVQKYDRHFSRLKLCSSAFPPP